MIAPFHSLLLSLSNSLPIALESQHAQVKIAGLAAMMFLSCGDRLNGALQNFSILEKHKRSTKRWGLPVIKLFLAGLTDRKNEPLCNSR